MLLNLRGQKFSRLLVIRRANGSLKWVCRCECGKIVHVITASLRNGNTQSCGCLNKDTITKHSLYKHPLYNVWNSMKQRCFNRNHKAYKNYGGRGIAVCSLWKQSFVEFYNWALQNGYKKGLTLDRRNNDKGYGPKNCRWVTYTIQNRNRRKVA